MFVIVFCVFVFSIVGLHKMILKDELILKIFNCFNSSNISLENLR